MPAEHSLFLTSAGLITAFLLACESQPSSSRTTLPPRVEAPLGAPDRGPSGKDARPVGVRLRTPEHADKAAPSGRATPTGDANSRTTDRPQGDSGDAARATPAAAAEKQTREGPEAIPRDGGRVYALSRNVWVRGGPNSDLQWIGFLWLGGSVRVRGDQHVPGAGCNGDWLPIEPRGWVCVDDKRATTNADHPLLTRFYRFRPRVETPFPHRYAAINAPLARYLALPDEDTQRARERGYSGHIDQVRQARRTGDTAGFPEHLGRVTVALSGEPAPDFPLLKSGLPELPPGLSEGRTSMVARSAFAYAAKADYGDRTFLLAADMSWVPQDRVELLEPVTYQGVELGGAFRLPLAGFRDRDRPAYRIQADGSLQIVPGHFKRLSFVNLSGEKRTIDERTFHRLEGEDLWLDESEAVIPQPKSQTPWGAPLNEPDKTGLAPKGRATWVEASILSGWLVAFEGTRPVYATLISAGRGGTPVRGKDPLTTASTPTGQFYFTGKFKTATMESSTSPILHADVPWTQNFSGPHALHSAYWHNDWGNLKSAGCVNVSPRDGKWLFEFTEPSVPAGWHGVRHVPRYGPATTFLLHE